MAALIYDGIKAAWHRLHETEREPHAIARGFAVGLFLGMLPVLGLQTVLALVLAFLIRGSKVAALLGTLLTNPVTFGPILWADYITGNYFLGGAPDPQHAVVIEKTAETVEKVDDLPVTKAPAHSLKTLVGMGWNFVAPVLLGGTVLGAGLALAAYFPIAWLAARLVKKKPALSFTRRMVMPVDRNDAPPASSDDHPKPQPPPHTNDKPAG